MPGNGKAATQANLVHFLHPLHPLHINNLPPSMSAVGVTEDCTAVIAAGDARPLLSPG